MTTALYLPVRARILEVRKLTEYEKFFRVDVSGFDSFDYHPGQFVQVSVFGAGECPISISSAPDGSDTIEMVVRKVGSLTGILHTLDVGDFIGLRGPFGHGFPMDEMEGKRILVIGGGIGLVPLRSVIYYYIRNKDKYMGMTVLHGAKSPQELLFTDEYDYWLENGVRLEITVDNASEDWTGNVGVITVLFDRIDIEPEHTCAVICGPPVMYRFVVEKLVSAGVGEDTMYLSLERNMKCGVGKCGHCAMGSYHVCIDGPVFTYAKLKCIKEAL